MIRRLSLAFLIFIVISIFWHYRKSEFIVNLLAPTPTKTTIKFDNGTVRQYEYQSSASQPLPNGKLRKCVSESGTTTYTNTICPINTKEQPVSASTFNIVSEKDDSEKRITNR